MLERIPLTDQPLKLNDVSDITIDDYTAAGRAFRNWEYDGYLGAAPAIPANPAFYYNSAIFRFLRTLPIDGTPPLAWEVAQAAGLSIPSLLFENSLRGGIFLGFRGLSGSVNVVSDASFIDYIESNSDVISIILAIENNREFAFLDHTLAKLRVATVNRVRALATPFMTGKNYLIQNQSRIRVKLYEGVDAPDSNDPNVPFVTIMPGYMREAPLNRMREDSTWGIKKAADEEFWAWVDDGYTGEIVIGEAN